MSADDLWQWSCATCGEEFYTHGKAEAIRELSAHLAATAHPTYIDTVRPVENEMLLHMARVGWDITDPEQRRQAEETFLAAMTNVANAWAETIKPVVAALNDLANVMAKVAEKMTRKPVEKPVDKPVENGWQAGDPCKACGSRNTGLGMRGQGICYSCGRSDDDE